MATRGTYINCPQCKRAFYSRQKSFCSTKCKIRFYAKSNPHHQPEDAMSDAEKIRARRDEIRAKMNRNKGEAEILLAEMKALQIECTHPNSRSQRCGDYDGSTYTLTSCPDCGMSIEN